MSVVKVSNMLKWNSWWKLKFSRTCLLWSGGNLTIRFVLKWREFAKNWNCINLGSPLDFQAIFLSWKRGFRGNKTKFAKFTPRKCWILTLLIHEQALRLIAFLFKNSIHKYSTKLFFSIVYEVVLMFFISAFKCPMVLLENPWWKCCQTSNAPSPWQWSFTRSGLLQRLLQKLNVFYFSSKLHTSFEAIDNFCHELQKGV